MNTPSKIIGLLAAVLLLFGYSACKKSDSGDAPVITRIRTISTTKTVTTITPATLTTNDTVTTAKIVSADSTTKTGLLNTQYAIVGQHLKTTTKLTINGASVYFSPTLVTDNTIIFTLPATVPYSSSSTSNKITVTTLYGSADFDFVIQQPVATFTSASQLAGNAGDQITLTGTTFNGLSSVKFGTVNATIVSSTATSAVVTVPTGLTGAAPISLTTTAITGGGTVLGPVVSGGINMSGAALTTVAPFGFNTLGYDDAFKNGWSDSGWSNTPNNSSTAVVKRGTSAIAVQYSGGFDGFVIQAGAPVTATSVKLSIYGGTGTDGKLIHLLINDNYNNYVTITLVAGAWTTYNIPLSAFGTGATVTVTDLIFQEFSGNPSLFYLDDVGVI